MGFVKTIKSKAYFKRFQVKFRRRREGKTDYQQRHKLIRQAKNKYNTPKYRFIVRFTNTDVITQIAYAKLKGDVIMTAAYAHELPRFGIKVGLTNYAAAYATGLLLARRHLDSVKLGKKYEGKTKVTGEYWQYEEDELEGGGAKPFRAFLDVGLARTTRGARIFACLKGAVDGGLDIPHSETRFAGYDAKKETLDSKKFRSYLLGGHVSNYMKKLNKDNPDKYKKQFAAFIKEGVTAEGMEAMYTKAHAAIRANPQRQKKETKEGEKKKETYNKKKKGMSREQRRGRVNQRLAVHGVKRNQA